jgi:mannose-6-phosphate isomerase-like protein (cupin superfamily)
LNFEMKALGREPDDLAPDGSEVRLLCRLERGSMAHFTLPAGHISRPIAHRTVEEIWYIVGGEGEMWRRQDDAEQVTSLRSGISLSIPVGTTFQFRASESTPLVAIGITMPPWPGANEATPAEGPWTPSL